VDAIVVLGVALVGGGLFCVSPTEILFAAAGATLVLRVSQRPPGLAVLALAALVFGASGWRAHRAVLVHEAERAAVARELPAPARCHAHGVVTESPVAVRGSLRWSAALEGIECGDAGGTPLPFAEPLAVTLYGGPSLLARGDSVEVIAQLARPQRFWNVETGDPRPGEARRGALLSGGVVDARITRSGTGPAAVIDRCRARVRARIEETFRPEVAPMARALVLGESDLAEVDDADFRASGLSHLLAVSGMHLVLVVAGFVKLAEAMLVRVVRWSARMDTGRVVAFVSIPLVWAYADFAGAGGSTVRAAWMMTAALAAHTIGRRSSAARAFGLSLLAMGASDPLVVYDVSFLLSAGATLGLITLSRPIASLATRFCAPPLPPRVARASAWLATTMSATLAATIPCAPILARFAPTLPAGGVFANLLAVPLGETIALPICLLHAVLGPFPSAERGCAAVATGALTMVRSVAHAFAHARWSLVQVPPPDGWECACLAVALLGAITESRWRRWSVLGPLAATVLLEVAVRHCARPRGVLRATFLDVGQGDSALVDLPSGDAVLIDGGGLVGSPVDTGVRVVAPVLRARRRPSLLAAVLSHPHPDHYTGLASGLDGIHLSALWDTGQGERERVGGGYATLLSNARKARVPILRPARLCGARELGGAWLEVLAPCPDTNSDRGPNDNSFVFKLTYGGRSVLFVGDAESEEEGDLLALGPARLHADLLKVGHHGSRTSSSPGFIAAVSPTEAVISSGVRNRFGHPHPKTLRTFDAAGVHVLRTDEIGAVTFWTDGARFEVRAAGEEHRPDLW
jgi:competence protein ComEC